VSGAILKTIAGLANNKGGHVLFGVKDGTDVVEGMSNDKFHTLDPSILNSHLLSTLDPVPTIKKVALSIGGKTVGAIYVEKHRDGPVIAVKNVGSDVREGAIYFRYVGETRRSADLRYRPRKPPPTLFISEPRQDANIPNMAHGTPLEVGEDCDLARIEVNVQHRGSAKELRIKRI
jgi:Putative DNA-binding domain